MLTDLAMRTPSPLAALLCAATTAALTLVAACSASAPADDVGTNGAAVTSFPGCSGSFNTKPSPNGSYYATDFGCSSDPAFTDPGDTCGSAACIQSAFDQGLCSSGESDATCQRDVNWYSIGGASYGCGARLKVTNPSNGKSVIVIVLDNGPSCTVENEADYWVLDVSYPTIMYLFGSQEGYSDHALIQVAVVASSTPLGPTSGAVATVDAGYGACMTPSGADGECISTSACAAAGGTSTSGECPGPSDIECCTMSAEKPADAGAPRAVDSGANYGGCTTASGAAGECISTSACAASGGTSTSGDCPGPDDIECCTKSDPALDAGYGGCTTGGGSEGVCISTTTCAAHGGTSTSGDCPGPDDIECCVGAT